MSHKDNPVYFWKSSDISPISHFIKQDKFCLILFQKSTDIDRMISSIKEYRIENPQAELVVLVNFIKGHKESLHNNTIAQLGLNRLIPYRRHYDFRVFCIAQSKEYLPKLFRDVAEDIPAVSEPIKTYFRFLRLNS